LSRRSDCRTLAKLGLRDRVAAVVFAFEHGLATPGRSTVDSQR
jgi:hypothetical protein